MIKMIVQDDVTKLFIISTYFTNRSSFKNSKTKYIGSRFFDLGVPKHCFTYVKILCECIVTKN